MFNDTTYRATYTFLDFSELVQFEFPMTDSLNNNFGCFIVNCKFAFLNGNLQPSASYIHFQGFFLLL
jgi:hypothetical protein